MKTLGKAWEDEFMKRKKYSVLESRPLDLYLADGWNALDWLSYLMLLIASISHIYALAVDTE